MPDGNADERCSICFTAEHEYNGAVLTPASEYQIAGMDGSARGEAPRLLSVLAGRAELYVAMIARSRLAVSGDCAEECQRQATRVCDGIWRIERNHIEDSWPLQI